MHRVMTGEQPFYFFPLQLDCDSQIRNHSSFGRIAPSIEFVINSFVAKAPSEAMLVIKEHPLDNALTNWRAMVEQVAAAAGVADRIVYLEGGDLDALIKKCEGVVLVNSTVGFLALSYSKPVIAMGEAIYDMPDLDFPGIAGRVLGQRRPTRSRHLRRLSPAVAVARTQVNGGFFSKAGLKHAIEGTVRRLETSTRDVRVPPPRGGEVMVQAVNKLLICSPRRASYKGETISGRSKLSTILITGASSGLGAELARAYARPGVIVGSDRPKRGET